MKKYFALILFFLFQTNVTLANFTLFKIGIDGLTCSACSKSVEMSLRKLPFVEDVKMDLEQTEAKIYVKKDSKIDFISFSNAVKNAGFSIRFLKAELTEPISVIAPNSCFELEGNIVSTSSSLLSKYIQILGEEFLTKKEWKNYKKALFTTCDFPKKVYFLQVINEI
jgi:copper chaperone CopZ